MKVAILFDSYFGNTEQIARAVGDISVENIEILTKRITEVSLEDISNSDVLIVGSPTRGFRPSDNTTKFLKKIPFRSLKGIKVAAFDTRMSLPDIESKTLRFIVKTGGYAAKHIAKALVKKGGDLVISPEGFLVADEKGPLVEGELQRANGWGNKIVKL